MTFSSTNLFHSCTYDYEDVPGRREIEEASEERMMPQDVNAFFKHPLVAASEADDGDAIALLHEYQTLYSATSSRAGESPSKIFDSGDRHDLNSKPIMSSVSEKNLAHCLDISLNSNLNLGRPHSEFQLDHETSLDPSSIQLDTRVSGHSKDFNYRKNDDAFGTLALSKNNLISGTLLSPSKFIDQEDDRGNLETLPLDILPSINILSRSTPVQSPAIQQKPINSRSDFLEDNQSVDWRNNATNNGEVENQMKLNHSSDKLINQKVPDMTAFSRNLKSYEYEDKMKMNNPLLDCDEMGGLKVHANNLPPLSLLNKNLSSQRISSIPDTRTHLQTNRIPVSYQSNSSNHFANNINFFQHSTPTNKYRNEISAIDMSSSSQSEVQKQRTNSREKFLTSKQYFGNSELIQMLEKQVSPEHFANSLDLQSSLNIKNLQKSNPNMPSLPFPLPAVPPGYRLVITHLPITNDQEPDSKHITQLIIDNPIDPCANKEAVNPITVHQQSLSPQLHNTFEVPCSQIRTLRSEYQISNTSSDVDLTSVMKEDILRQSLEEANIMPLLSQNPSPFSNPPSDLTAGSSSLELPLSQTDPSILSNNWSTVDSNGVTSSTISGNLANENNYYFNKDLTKTQDSSAPLTRRPTYRGKSHSARWNHISYIPKIEPDTNGLDFYLEAAISTNTKKDEDRVTYLNKSQYYALVLTHTPVPSEFLSGSTSLKSIVMLVFRERMSVDEELQAWECWYSRQHSYKQRVLDIDSKNSSLGEEFSSPSLIEEVAHNAVAVTWDRYTSVKLNLALNCLSTDFSHQKGIRGNPLHIQIDTYKDGVTSNPSHRTYCQIKVFCDKGADRKAREEERKRLKENPGLYFQWGSR